MQWALTHRRDRSRGPRHATGGRADGAATPNEGASRAAQTAARHARLITGDTDVGIAVVVGNPKPKSRTLEAAVHVATQLGGGPPATVIDVIDLGPGLLGWGDPEVAAALEAVRGADAVVVAS